MNVCYIWYSDLSELLSLQNVVLILNILVVHFSSTDACLDTYRPHTDTQFLLEESMLSQEKPWVYGSKSFSSGIKIVWEWPGLNHPQKKLSWYSECLYIVSSGRSHSIVPQHLRDFLPNPPGRWCVAHLSSREARHRACPFYNPHIGLKGNTEWPWAV